MDRLVAPVPNHSNNKNINKNVHLEQHSSLQSHSSGQLQSEILQRQEHSNITGKKFTSETTIESRKTSSETSRATGTTAQGLTTETVENVDIADEMYLEAQKKRKEAQEILESETRLCASASTLQKDLQKRLKFFKERENVEELEANQALEIERKLELERKRAHEQAVLHEQKRTEAAAQRKVAEMELETAIMEEEKHRLAAEKARAMISKFELDIEEAMFRKKREEFDVKNKTILTMDLSKFEQAGEQKEVIAVPREMPEQIMISEAHAKPVTMKIPDIRIPAQQAEASIQTETSIRQVTVEEEGKHKQVLEERKVQETTTRLSLQK